MTEVPRSWASPKKGSSAIVTTSTLVGYLLLFVTGTPCCSRGGAPGELCLRRIPVLYRRDHMAACLRAVAHRLITPSCLERGGLTVPPETDQIPANPSRMPGKGRPLLVAGPTTRRGPWSRHHSGSGLGFEPTPIPGCCADP